MLWCDHDQALQLVDRFGSTDQNPLPSSHCHADRFTQTTCSEGVSTLRWDATTSGHRYGDRLCPRVIIADEPTTALDVTVQATVLQILRELAERLRTAVVLITHDLGVVADIADMVAVMYASRIVEQGTVNGIFAHPTHPYTRALLAPTPVPGEGISSRLAEMPGVVPTLSSPAQSCAFAERCTRAIAATVDPATSRNTPYPMAIRPLNVLPRHDTYSIVCTAGGASIPMPSQSSARRRGRSGYRQRPASFAPAAPDWDLPFRKSQPEK